MDTSAIDSKYVRDLVVEAARSAASLMDRPEVEQAWTSPSALAGMTVGALAAHLVRATGATLAYLDRTDVGARPEGDLLTPITYFHFAVDSPIHAQIKDVSSKEAAVGYLSTVAKFRSEVDDLARRLADEPHDRLIAALGGQMMTLDDFCRTRLIEILLHVDDLANSVALPRPDSDPDAVAIVVDIITGIARHVHGDWAVLHALARDERRQVDIFPVF